MKKSFILWIAMLTTCMASAQVSTWNGTHEPWTHGTGTEADPFLIENAQQLAYLAYRVNNGLDAGGGHVSNHDYHYKLMVDVDLNGSEDFQWTPIGYYNSNSDYQCFGGYFDGNSHIVSGLYINSATNRVGFFGYTNGASVEALWLNTINIYTTGDYIGGIIGCANNTNIFNCYNSGNVTANSYWNGYSGGILGYANGTISIINCYNSGNVTASSSSNCYSGGIVGYVYNSTITITNCHNSGCVTANSYSNTSYVGGIIGYSNSGNSNINIAITNCYNIGNVTATSYYNYCGGIIGFGNSPNNTNYSYYLSTCGGNNTYGGQPMTADAMKTAEFVDILNYGTNVWTVDANNVNQCYPILSNMLYVRIITSEATGITNTHATLNGETFSTETITVQGFEYKIINETNYQSVNVSNSGEMTKILSGLFPGIPYTYRTFCKIGDRGTIYGEDKTFSTLPISITTNSATNITGSSAILNGSINIGDATLVSKGFEYRAVGEVEYSTLFVTDDDDDYAIPVTGLTVNTTYEYYAFMNIAEIPMMTINGATKTFEVTWLNQDTIYINNSEMLRWVSEQCNSGTTFENKCIKLTNDIVLPENVPNNMTSIGVYPNYPFKGTFNGNGKLIHNLYIDKPNTPYQGFFGYTLNANLYNVGLVNITASGRNYTGGMVAYAENTHMRDCYVNGGTLFALSYCGGLVGYQEQGTNSIISGCYNTCEVTGNNYVGGLIGFSNYSTVRNSYVAGRVSAQGDAVGAIIGGANEVLMYYCYFSTEITGQTNAIGENNNGNGKEGGEGLTNAQMRDPQFVNTLNQNLVTPVWMADYATHINNGFPIIKWQRPGTSVEENIITKNSISLYPNPTNDFVTIQSDNPNVSLRHVEIYDVMGRKVMSEVLNGQSQGFSIEILPAGFYNVRILTDNGCYTNLKLIVQ